MFVQDKAREFSATSCQFISVNFRTISATSTMFLSRKNLLLHAFRHPLISRFSGDKNWASP